MPDTARLEEPTRRVFEHQLVVRITSEMYDALTALAVENDRTLAQEVRRAVKRYLDA